MNGKIRGALPLLAAVMIAACAREEPAERPAEEPAAPVVTLGADSAGRLTPKEEFDLGEEVVVTVFFGRARQAAEVRVIWLDADGVQVGESSTQIAPGQRHLRFTADTASLPPGEYRAEVLIGEEKIAERQFRIVGELPPPPRPG